MNPVIAAIVLLLGADKAAAPAATSKPAATPALTFQADSLCTTEEKPVFSCRVKKGKFASLCASSDYSETSGHLVYRFGKPNAVELTFPSKADDASRSAFTYRTMMVSGGGGGWYRFSNGDVDYVLFDGSGKGWAEAGVAVIKNDEEIARLTCTDVPQTGPSLPVTEGSDDFEFVK